MRHDCLYKNTIMEENVPGGMYEEVVLPVAPVCNMQCNFCSKGGDCICNGNNPQYLSRPMTPRQAVNWAAVQAEKNSRIGVIRIAGPGEPLCNLQTFEVLKRLKEQLPGYLYTISTNGLLLEESLPELVKAGVRIVEVGMSAMYEETFKKLFARVIKRTTITSSAAGAEAVIAGQLCGIRQCRQQGLDVKINTVYYPGINEYDIYAIADQCRQLDIASLCIISGFPGGKFSRQRIPELVELIALKNKLSKMVRQVDIKYYSPAQYS